MFQTKRQVLIQFIIVLCAAISLSSCKNYETPLAAQNTSSTNFEPVVLINASVKIAVGDIVYENLDAQLRVRGYDSDNRMEWTQDYNLTGPADTLTVKNGFHHYSIELVNKWGVNDIQSDIAAKDIWDGRANGPLPVTYNLGGSKNARRLTKLVTSRETNIPGTGLVYQTESRIVYQYNTDGLPQSILHELYDPQTAQFEETMTESFTYSGKAVSKIATTLNGQPYAEYSYEYGSLDKITETNYNTGILTTQLIRRNYETSPNDSSISILYSFSNGNSVRYDFGLLFKNIVNDKTRLSGQICNVGNYDYDKNINPFKHLGYIDFALQNWSASNKIAERVNYLACSYPTVIPLFHDYTYDQDGYPVTRITTYSSGANQNSPYHSKEDFYYE